MSNGISEAATRSPQGSWRTRARPVVAAALALQLMIALLVVGADQARVEETSTTRGGPGLGDAASESVPAADAVASLPEAGTAPLPVPEPAIAPVAPPEAAPVPPSLSGPAPEAVQDIADLVVPEPGPPPPPGPRPAGGVLPSTTFAASAPTSDSARIFASQHPEHAAARQRGDVPSSFHWAVIIGVNDYMGRTTNTIGSVGDAHTLRDTLYSKGWRGDQVLTLTNHAATHDQIVRAIEWLIRSTDENSTVIFSFSGHMRHNGGVTALWPADNRFIWAGDLGRMLGAVRADRMWVSLQGCHAGGLAAPGLEGPNRLVAYASRVEEKAYEDPATGHSVMGYYFFEEGLRQGLGTNNGAVTVQNAFAWGAPKATWRTTGQSHGAQRPILVDGLGGRSFPVAVTGAPPPPASPSAGTPDKGNDRSQPRSGLLRLLPDLPV